MLSFGSVCRIIGCVQKFGRRLKWYTQTIFLFIIILYTFKSTWCEFFALIFIATEKLEKTGGIFYFFLPLKVDQIFTKVLCCFYLDIDMNTCKRLSYHIYPWVWLSPIHAFILRVTPGYAKIQVNKFPVLTLSYILFTWNILGSNIGVSERSIVDGCPCNFFLPHKYSFDFLAVNFIHICLFTWRGEEERGGWWGRGRERKRTRELVSWNPDSFSLWWKWRELNSGMPSLRWRHLTKNNLFIWWTYIFSKANFATKRALLWGIYEQLRLFLRPSWWLWS